MKVGIIVYSQTGNTLSVAQKLEKALKSTGHEVNIARVEPMSKDPKSREPMLLKTAPDITPYDTVVFASPVQAFSLAPVMKQYLSGISNLNGKKTYCFVTQQLKKPWMGGNHAVRQISSACEAKGSRILLSGIVNWSSDAREKQIEELISSFNSI